MHARNADGYISCLSRLINNKNLRDKIGNGMRLLMPELYNVRRQLLLEDMRGILE